MAAGPSPRSRRGEQEADGGFSATGGGYEGVDSSSLWVTPPDETSQVPVPARLGPVCQHNQINITAMSPSRPSL
ncbi:hypothetical protein Pme01_52760 [Planosporangium mesophilum]|uniref:Uncharacterized protein n=1 Tax=Planosporangium mesophilum TaxID=689768 RepID=A0A8J3TJB7_9ACTN|nr:hypothetical protein Pme01_52760 [Planosporangium mesophilum]